MRYNQLFRLASVCVVDSAYSPRRLRNRRFFGSSVVHKAILKVDFGRNLSDRSSLGPAGVVRQRRHPRGRGARRVRLKDVPARPVREPRNALYGSGNERVRAEVPPKIRAHNRSSRLTRHLHPPRLQAIGEA
jgi:hypothetical protein